MTIHDRQALLLLQQFAQRGQLGAPLVHRDLVEAVQQQQDVALFDAALQLTDREAGHAGLAGQKGHQPLPGVRPVAQPGQQQ